MKKKQEFIENKMNALLEMLKIKYPLQEDQYKNMLKESVKLLLGEIYSLKEEVKDLNDSIHKTQWL